MNIFSYKKFMEIKIVSLGQIHSSITWKKKKKDILRPLVIFAKLHPERGAPLFGSVSLHVGVRGCGSLTQAVEGSHAVHHPAADGVVGQ